MAVTVGGQDAGMDLGLTDRVYLVTGASGGLGFATAEALVADGARVVLNGRDEGSLAAAVDALGKGDRVLGVPGDLADSGLGARLAAAAVARFGRLDGALVSVGGPPAGETLALDDDAWRAGFESVFLGALRIARAVATSVGEEGGSIAFVLSTSVKAPIDGLAASNGLRPGLGMLAKSMADELGPRNIRVNGLMPGRIETDRIVELDGEGAKGRRSREAWEKRIPLRRYGDPEEFGRVAAFVLSPAASFLSGAMIPVDGGMMRAI
jgi:3-oxoacyl-[acyl-carrier protein] reductase